MIQNRLRTERASLEKIDCVYEKRVVEVKTLDSFNLNDVDLIKIDVEGHEKRVLVGSLDTISRCKPILLIEIEQRHIDYDINEIFSFIENLGYQGFFLMNGEINEIHDFERDKHQMISTGEHSKNLYINNFIFIPISRSVDVFNSVF